MRRHDGRKSRGKIGEKPVLDFHVFRHAVRRLLRAHVQRHGHTVRAIGRQLLRPVRRGLRLGHRVGHDGARHALRLGRGRERPLDEPVLDAVVLDPRIHAVRRPAGRLFRVRTLDTVVITLATL